MADSLNVDELIKRIQQENAKSRSRTSTIIGRYFASFLGQNPETLNDISTDVINSYLDGSPIPTKPVGQGGEVSGGEGEAETVDGNDSSG